MNLPKKTHHIPILLLTGLSGSGKSSILSILEDISFYTIHGIPVELIPRIVSTILPFLPTTIKGIAIIIQPIESITQFNKNLYTIKGQLQELNTTPTLIFVEASLPTLIKRYIQTRRPHPKEYHGTSLEQAVEEEEEELRSIREYSDLVINTTDYTIHTLRKYIHEQWVSLDTDFKKLFRIQLLSFGFKHGIPKDADMIFDVRFLPNPYFIEELRDFTGLDKCIQDYVFANEIAHTTLQSIIDYLTTILPLYSTGDWRRISIAIGCTGGKHRSVTIMHRLAEYLEDNKYHINIEDRNILD